MGYEVDEAEVAYWGRCPDCLAQARAPFRSDSPTRRRGRARTSARTRRSARTEGQTDPVIGPRGESPGLTTGLQPTTEEVSVNMDNEQRCPVPGKAHGGRSNRDWWPNQLNLKVSTRIRQRAIPWARSSTTPKSSRRSISTP